METYTISGISDEYAIDYTKYKTQEVILDIFL